MNDITNYKRVTLTLSKNQYERLSFLSRSLNMSIRELLNYSVNLLETSIKNETFKDYYKQVEKAEMNELVEKMNLMIINKK